MFLEIKLYSFFSSIASQLHEPNDIFHSSTSDRENTCSSGSHGKKRSNSGTATAIEGVRNVSNMSDEYLATTHKRAKSENGKNIPTSEESNISPPLPGIYLTYFVQTQCFIKIINKSIFFNPSLLNKILKNLTCRFIP